MLMHIGSVIAYAHTCTHTLLTMVRPTAGYLDDLAQLGPTVTGLFVCLSSTMNHTHVRKRLDDKQRLWKNNAFGAKKQLKMIPA